MQALLRQSFRGVESAHLASGAQAAVLMAFTDPGNELILIKRAAHLKHHPGEMAFPGGRLETGDRDLVHTALREAWEEVGLPSERVTVLGAMPPNCSRFGVPVLPVIGIVSGDLVLTPNPDELDAIHRVPFTHFMHTSPSLLHEVEYLGQRVLMPGYPWAGEVIWGLSARFIVSLLETVQGAPIPWPEPVVQSPGAR